MLPALPRRSRLRTLLLWAAPLGWLGCGGGGGTDIVLPSLSVTTATDGVELDPDGYSLLIDGSGSQAIGVAATLVVDRLTDGQHEVQLAGMAPNCTAQGANPQTVTVRSGSTASLSFSVRCNATTGSIQVTTSTTGPDADPDGFTLVLDASAWGPVAPAATATVPGITPGSHSIGLTGLAANCQVEGENPRPVAVSPGQTVTIPFSVTCSTPTPGAGTLEVTTTTTGENPDDGYSIAVDGGAAQPIGANATVSLANMSPAQHRVQLQGIAANCSLQGDNPVRISVASGATARVAFAVSCSAIAPQPGSLRVAVQTSGSSPDGSYTVALDGGNPLSLSGSRTIENLTPGSHSVLLGDVAANCTVAAGNPQSATIVAGQMASLTFQVSCIANAPSVNLRIQRIALTQSTQDQNGNVPLVQARDGFIRVFVTATGSGSVTPSVRVRFFRDGTTIQSFTISDPGSSTPSAVEEGSLQSSWNLKIPGSLIQPNTAVLADVDPDNAVPESNEGDNTFPASGDAQPLSVQPVPPATITLIPIRQTSTGKTGAIRNPAEMIELTRRMHPLGNVKVEVGDIFTIDGPIGPTDFDMWNQILSDLEARRIADDATDRTYYGVLHLDYSSGIVGNGFVGAPSAIGWDDPADGSRVMAHELGHTWNQLHTPCGGPPGVDPLYPYKQGNIGVYGFDVSGNQLKQPSLPDIMGYCDDPWISDYTYQRVLNYRRTHPLTSEAAQVPQPCILVWGHITNGQAVLEPSFQIVTRPRLPQSSGPYSLQASAADGSSLFTLSFEATESGDDPRGSKHFAFAIPVSQARATQLGSMRLIGPGIRLQSVSRSFGQLQQGAAQDRITARAETGAVRLEWNAAAHPMLMVRDPDSGEVLAFARGGNARVWTAKSAVDLEVSNGVGSQRLRLAISR